MNFVLPMVSIKNYGKSRRGKQMDGGWEKIYDSQSEADLAFANDLAFGLLEIFKRWMKYSECLRCFETNMTRNAERQPME
ncbi:hypothetical protein EfmAA290_24600 [Enterococcus faecium]|nr:hypothetical protein EfmAA290_24600 [Enterococcus faecium]